MIPPILWDLAADARWALMEGDVSVTHIVSVDALVGIELDDVRVVGVVDANGPLPWSYEVLVRGEIVTIGAVRLLDVVYNYETLVSAGARLLESASKFATTIAHGV